MTQNRLQYALMSALACAFLLVRYGHFIELSGDFVQHYLLVNEIMTHGYRRPETQMGIMSIYPDGAHWMAAVLGWIGGSGLVAIVLITIVAVFVSWLLVLELIGKDSPVKVALAIAAFLLLRNTNSLIGWEVSVNYFWPQLVDDVALLGTLLALARVTNVWSRAALIFVVGGIAMSVHALIALQILACGLTVIAWSGAVVVLKERRFPFAIAAALAALGIGALAILKFHPSFQAMRQAAETDGYLEFSYSAVIPVVLACAAIAVIALWRGRVALDTVLGCAGIATAVLAIAQYGMLHIEHAGSNYAVKKHMFVIVTLAMVNVVRMLGEVRDTRWYFGWLAAPVLAGAATVSALSGFVTPVAPVLRALSYAEHAAQFDLPGFSPGNTVSAAKDMPPMINFMISMTAFQHPVRVEDYRWMYGSDPKPGASYAMVLRTPEIDAKCTNRHAESFDYVIVGPDCFALSEYKANPGP
jgi:hypothetical protein